jgi:hypothetical protein
MCATRTRKSPWFNREVDEDTGETRYYYRATEMWGKKYYYDVEDDDSRIAAWGSAIRQLQAMWVRKHRGNFTKKKQNELTIEEEVVQ